jgi:hypothetical protein
MYTLDSQTLGGESLNVMIGFTGFNVTLVL